jgi:hypothetical protein
VGATLQFLGFFLRVISEARLWRDGLASRNSPHVRFSSASDPAQSIRTRVCWTVRPAYSGLGTQRSGFVADSSKLADCSSLTAQYSRTPKEI